VQLPILVLRCELVRTNPHVLNALCAKCTKPYLLCIVAPILSYNVARPTSGSRRPWSFVCPGYHLLTGVAWARDIQSSFRQTKSPEK